MGLFIPNAKPRRFHLEIPEREQRRQRLRQLEKDARRDMASRLVGEAGKVTERDFSHIRGAFRYKQRGVHQRIPMLASVLWIFLLVVVLSALWIWLLN